MAYCHRSFLNQRLLTEFETSLRGLETRLNQLDERLQSIETSATTPVLASWSTFPDRIEALEERMYKVEQLETRLQKIDDLEARMQKLVTPARRVTAEKAVTEKLAAAKIKPAEGQDQSNI